MVNRAYVVAVVVAGCGGGGATPSTDAATIDAAMVPIDAGPVHCARLGFPSVPAPVTGGGGRERR